MSCRKAGTISIPGVYVGMGDKVPLGAAMNKGLTIKMGQTHVQAYTKPLLEKIEAGDGTMAMYRDVIALKDDDHRVLTAHVLGDDGTWQQFMTSNYRRTT